MPAGSVSCLRRRSSRRLVLGGDEQPLLGVQHACAPRLALGAAARADSPCSARSRRRDRPATERGTDTGTRGGAGRDDAHAPLPWAARDRPIARRSASAPVHRGAMGRSVAAVHMCRPGWASDRGCFGRPCSTARARGPLSASDSRPIVRPRHAGNIADAGRRISAAESISDNGGLTMSSLYEPVRARAHARTS